MERHVHTIKNNKQQKGNLKPIVQKRKVMQQQV